MALTIEQIQSNITNKMDAREIINQIADYIQANLSSSGGSSYLVYTALLSQSGTGAPVPNIIQNTLGFTPVWSRDTIGEYTLTYTGGFPPTKTFLIVSNSLQPEYQMSLYNWDDNNRIGLTMNASGSSSDDWTELMVEIRVYP